VSTFSNQLQKDPDRPSSELIRPPTSIVPITSDRSHKACATAPEVLERLGRGEDVDASEYTFRTSTRIETASRELDWLNKGVFVGVGGRRPRGVIYETYLVA